MIMIVVSGFPGIFDLRRYSFKDDAGNVSICIQCISMASACITYNHDQLIALQFFNAIQSEFVKGRFPALADWPSQLVFLVEMYDDFYWSQGWIQMFLFLLHLKGHYLLHGFSG